MLIKAKMIIYLTIMAILVSGCSVKAVKDIGNETDSTGKSDYVFSKEPSDKDMFEEALSYINNKEEETNYAEAKTKLETLVAQFPKSKWIAGAQALILSLDRISALQAKLKLEKQKANAEQVKLTKEIEGLRDNIRPIEEKHSAEILRLQQENEQLKNDIQQLKKLEIQLEKREKMLR